MRICCLNNYPLDKMRRLAQAGGIPAQHAWGVDALARAGHALEFAPFHERVQRSPLDLASRWTGQVLGQLDQELYALSSRSDLLYCADSRSARGLALLRAVVKHPIVTILHHPARHGVFQRAVMRGTDAVLCLSRAVEEEARRMGARNTKLVTWGPELSSPLYARDTSEENGVVSAGKSGRDLTTLAAALELAAQPGVIYDTEGQLMGAPQRVRIVRGGGEGADPDAPATYVPARVLADLARASVVAIPARVTPGLIGLTEVNDALALAKPIVMTRVPSFPFDIEAVGCGLLVAPGDVEGWVRALRRLSDPGLRRELGRQGRRFAEREWNYTRFCDELVETVGRL